MNILYIQTVENGTTGDFRKTWVLGNGILYFILQLFKQLFSANNGLAKSKRYMILSLSV